MKHTRRGLLKAVGSVAFVPGLKGLGASQATAGTPVVPTEARWQSEPAQPFLFPGDRNIRDEVSFGIINGLITTGVNYQGRRQPQRPLRSPLCQFRFPAGGAALRREGSDEEV